MKEFVKWVVGMRSRPDPRHTALYQRAIICQTFPAYTLETAKAAPARDILQALELLSTAAKARSNGK